MPTEVQWEKQRAEKQQYNIAQQEVVHKTHSDCIQPFLANKPTEKINGVQLSKITASLQTAQGSALLQQTGTLPG